MALDMLVDATQLDSALSSVADAIRAKGGTSAQLAFPTGFVSAINNIPTGGSSEWTINEVTLVADTANTNELLLAIAPSLEKYKLMVYWLKSTQVKNIQNHALGGYAYKSGDSAFSGGNARYNYGYSGGSGNQSYVSKSGDVWCWIGGLPKWS